MEGAATAVTLEAMAEIYSRGNVEVARSPRCPCPIYVIFSCDCTAGHVVYIFACLFVRSLSHLLRGRYLPLSGSSMGQELDCNEQRSSPRSPQQQLEMRQHWHEYCIKLDPPAPHAQPLTLCH
jgi:hypothetical protein